MPISSSYPYTRPTAVPWDKAMRAQLPSGAGSQWYVTIDKTDGGWRGGRICNIRTLQCEIWRASHDGVRLLISTSEVPRHCLKTAERLLRMATHRDLGESVKAEIEAETPRVFDIAAEHGQMFANVKHLRWFARCVAESLQAECRKFFHLKPIGE